MGQVVSQVGARAAARQRLPFIAADVGGTFARLGLVTRLDEARRAVPNPFRTYRCADYPSLEAIFREFLASLGGLTVRNGAVASAGYPLGGKLIQTNLPWPVDIARIREDLGFHDLTLINDFTAIAYGTQFLEPREMTTLSTVSAPVAPGPILVLGPGTGLGASVLIPGKGTPTVLTTEAGQAAFAPTSALELELLALLRERFEHVSIERVLSGPGLVNLYSALSSLRSSPPRHRTPEDISAAALGGGDAVARDALEAFCGLMGSVAGDLALLYGAHGGVFLAGGILPRLKDFLFGSRFLERFVSKGPMRSLLERVPVRLIEDGQLGVIGAASWYLDTQSGK